VCWIVFCCSVERLFLSVMDREVSERNVGSVEALHLNWELFNFVLEMQRSLPEEIWSGVTRPSVDLVLAKENVFFDEVRHRIYHLLSRYLDVVYGHVIFEADAERDIIVLKWIFVLDRLASGPPPIMFPLAGQLLYGDNQWLLGRDRRQWESLLPPWDLPFGFSIDVIPFRPLDVEARINKIEIFLDSFVLKELEDDQPFDFLPMLMGWILCPSSHGWHDYGWESPHVQSAEARTCLLWQMLVHLQRILHRDRLVFPGSKAADSLEILRWACRISDILTCSYDPDLDQGSVGWLDLLGVSRAV